MNSIEKINERILEDGRHENKKIIEAANEKRNNIIHEAESKSEQIKEQAKIQRDKLDASWKEKAIASADAQSGKAILAFKINEINKTLNLAMETMDRFDDDKYFDIIYKLLKNNLLEKNGVISFSDKDLKRIPSDFEARLNEISGGKISLNKSSTEIKNGFILSYGDIEINCTFDELFNSCRDELKDIVNKKLFGDKKL